MKAFFKKIVQRLLGSFYTPALLFKKRHFPNAEDIKEQEDLAKRQCFLETFLQKDDLVFDVGANVGNRIVPLLAAGARVVAVEPQESCYRYLNRRFGNKIILVKKGIGSKEEILAMHVSADTVFSSFSTQWINSVKTRRLRKVVWSKVQQVQMTTLDRLIAMYGVPAFIKIDVEGFELQVLQGLTQKINMISYEYTTPEQTEAAQQCLHYIQCVMPDIECNYAVGETTGFCFADWKSADEMAGFMATNTFINSRFGDIYVRLRQL